MALSRQNTRKLRGGVTLLELLLALALSVVVLSAIGMAIRLHFKMLDVRRTSTEEMQVVRVVTQRITEDLRMMVQPNKPDLSGLETAFQNAMQAAASQTQAALTGTAAGAALGTTLGTAAQGGGGGAGAGSGNQNGGGGGQVGGGGQGSGQGGGQGAQGAGGQSGGQGGGGGQGGAMPATGQARAGQATGGAAAGGGGASGTTGSGTSGSGTSAGGSGVASQSSGSTATSSTSAATSVQLIGSATELRFDISRLPRVDQYKGIFTSNGEASPVDLPSDVKTIAYFLQSDQSYATNGPVQNPVAAEASTDGYGRGLMRAEMDRAVTTWAETNGGAASVYSGAQLLADEVVGLGFEYYDGVEWLTEWDSTASGGLPRAIRVWLSILPTYGMSERELADSTAGKEPQSTDFYFVISLPTAPLVATTATETTDTSGASSSQSTGSTTQGAAP